MSIVYRGKKVQTWHQNTKSTWIRCVRPAMMLEDLQIVNADIPDDWSRYGEKIKKAIASGVSEKSHEEIFGNLKKRYGA